MRSIPAWASVLCVAGTLTASLARSQSTHVDYLLIDRMDQTYVGSFPQHAHDWVLPGGGCLTIVGPGFAGSNPTRTTDHLVAIGYNHGPNGVKEWGAGDDVLLGPVSATWSVAPTANEAHSGSFCLTDSPGGYYSTNQNLSATINRTFNLAGRGDIDVSYFHHWENGYSGGAQIRLEIRANAGAWTTLKTYAFVGGWHGSYLAESVDLSSYSGQTIELRFRIATGSSSPCDGWYIDDVHLQADGEVLFHEDFETGTDGWLLDAPWGLLGSVTDTPYLTGDSVSKDRFGAFLCTINATTGELKANPVTVPTQTRQGMGYAWVTASLGSLTDGVMVYSGAPEYVPE